MNQPPPAIKVTCPQCHAILSVPKAAVGSTITCSDCLEDFVATPIAPEPPFTPLDRPHEQPSAADDGALDRLLNLQVDDDSGAIRLDDLADVTPVTKKPKVLESNYEFSVSCMLCGTRVDVNDSLIGKKVKCPDCHSPIEVRTPSPDKRRSPVHADASEHADDDFGFANIPDAPIESSPYHSIANDLMASAESEVAGATTVTSQVARDPALDALKRAEEAVDEVEESERPPLPPAPFRTGVLNFLSDPLTIARLLMLAFALFLELGAIQSAIVSAEGGPITQFLSVVARMFAVVFGIMLITNLSVSLLGILSDSANGNDKIESWPDVNFLDWIGDSLFVFGALFLSVLAPCAVAEMTYLIGIPSVVFWIIAILGSALGILLIFPFALVSMLESGSPINPISEPIKQSLRLATGSWITFTIISGCLVFVGAGLCTVRLALPDNAAINFIIAVLLTLVMAVYFRLLGRLTWCCDEAVLAEHLRVEEAVESADS